MTRAACSVATAVCLATLAGCGGLQEAVEAGPGAAGEKIVSVKARSFAFEPNNVVARHGDVLVMEVENVSGTTHNLTVVGPRGDLMTSVELPGGETTHVELRLAQPGPYEFYCDKPFHPTLGMRGRIEAK